MTSDPNDFIGAGKMYSYSTPTTPFVMSGERRSVTIYLGSGWWLDFAAAGKGPLRRGRYVNARRGDFTGIEPKIDISGRGRGCNQTSGEFTIRDVSFNRRGVPIAIAISFEQHCEGLPPALRGTVTYRR